jgi:hypothetical protein
MHGLRRLPGIGLRIDILRPTTRLIRLLMEFALRSRKSLRHRDCDQACQRERYQIRSHAGLLAHVKRIGGMIASIISGANPIPPRANVDSATPAAGTSARAS